MLEFVLYMLDFFIPTSYKSAKKPIDWGKYGNAYKAVDGKELEVVKFGSLWDIWQPICV